MDELGIVVVAVDGTVECSVNEFDEEKRGKGCKIVDPSDLSRSRHAVVCCEIGKVGSIVEFEGEDIRGGRKGR
jgi:hypothetical protein